MIRKTLVVAAAMAIPAVFLAATGGVAGAKATGVQLDTLHCTSESATATFGLPITTMGVTSGQQTTSLAGQIGGCTVIGPTPVAGTVSGVISGTLLTGKPGSVKHPAAQCTGLAPGTIKEKGTLTVTWSDPSDAAVNGVTGTTAVKSISGSTVTVSGNVYGLFTVNGKASKSNLFQGTDKGKSSSVASQTVMQAGALIATCGSPGGLPSIQLQAPPAGLAFS
jgi:hypothetical protein